MKKLYYVLLFSILTISVIACSCPTQAQDITNQAVTEYVTTSDIEKLLDKYGTKAYDELVVLADKLNGPAKDGFEILVRYNYYYGVLLLFIHPLLAILLLIGSLIWYAWAVKRTDMNSTYSSSKGDNYLYKRDDAAYIAPIVSMSCAAAWIVIAVILIFTGGYLQYTMPEYFAIKDLIGFIK